MQQFVCCEEQRQCNEDDDGAELRLMRYAQDSRDGGRSERRDSSDEEQDEEGDVYSGIDQSEECEAVSDARAGQPQEPRSTDAAPAEGNKSKKKIKKKKKLKQVLIRLDSLAHQRLMKVVSDQYGGSLEMFVNAAVDSRIGTDRKAGIRKPNMAKWKRMKFEQLKSSEMPELAMTFQSLAESATGIELPNDLVGVPWHELRVVHLEKMLEHTKKMLLLNDKAYDCPHDGCNRRFTTRGSFGDHLNEHSGEKPYICSFDNCALQFSSKQLLNRHIKKHERAHKCTFEGCDKRFAFRERLIVHQKTHCDERPLPCPYEGCGKSFKWANSLNGHIRTHTGEKPFHCTFGSCGKLFGYKVDLTRHLRTHYGQHARSNPR